MSLYQFVYGKSFGKCGDKTISSMQENDWKWERMTTYNDDER